MLKKLMLTIGLMSAVALAACRPVDLPTAQPPASGDATPTPGAKPAPLPTSPEDGVVSATPINDEKPPSLGPADKPLPTPAYAPQAGDSALVRDAVYVSETELLLLESFPAQVVVRLGGALPTPCHELRVAVAAPEAPGKIALDVYSVVDPNRICVQVLKDFEVSVPLGAFAAGNYSVWVNDQAVGEFSP
jgi:hypothetical protein